MSSASGKFRKTPNISNITNRIAKFRAPLIVLGFVFAGLILFVAVKAAPGFLSLEAENSSCSGDVRLVDDTTASGGKAVKFGTTTGTSCALALTGLDSTIRGNWDASGNTGLKFQVVSVWTGDGVEANGSKLVGTKLVGPTAGVVDMNNLRTGDLYTLKIQNIDANGAISQPILQASARTEEQKPITNAAFFDNFNDTTHGVLNPNYYDVRSFSHYGDPYSSGVTDAISAFVSERHWHGSLLEAQGQGSIMVRPRAKASLVNADGSDRTMTMQFEVDMLPGQRNGNHGKWWEVNFSEKIPATGGEFGGKGHAGFPNSIVFAAHERVDNYWPGYEERGNTINIPNIEVNVNGTVKHCESTSKTGIFTPGNVRVPVVLKVSRTSAEMFLNGVSWVKCTGFTLPFTSGYWNFIDANYRPAFLEGDYQYQFPMIFNKLSHWDMIQWDGPAGSINNERKVFGESGCSLTVKYNGLGGLHNCPLFINGGTTGTATVNIPSSTDLQGVKEARITFVGVHTGGSAKVNGTSIGNFPAALQYGIEGIPADHDVINAQTEIVLTPAQIALLKAGSNQIQVTMSKWNKYGAMQIELIYDRARTIANPPQDFMGMLGVTANNFRHDRKVGGPTTATNTTYLYSTGSEAPVDYTIQQINPAANKWFKLDTPSSGTVTSIPKGGSLVPISYTVDLTQTIDTTPGDTQGSNMGELAVLKITGGGMTVYVGILGADMRDFSNQSWLPIQFLPIKFNNLIFNKSALPQ